MAVTFRLLSNVYLATTISQWLLLAIPMGYLLGLPVGREWAVRTGIFAITYMAGAIVLIGVLLIVLPRPESFEKRGIALPTGMLVRLAIALPFFYSRV